MTAIICSTIIGGSLYAVQISKQKSIEHQKQMEINQENLLRSNNVIDGDSKSLSKEMVLIYREECKDELSRKISTVDQIVQSNTGITPEQAKNIAINAGIADKNGYIIDEDILVKDCVDKKITIFE